MKYTKNAKNKKNGNKITFRVNVIEDRERIQYIDRAKNGSGFIKEAIKFYIMALEKGLVNSFYLEDTNKKWENVLNDLESANKKVEINESVKVPSSNNDEIVYPEFNINDFEDSRLEGYTIPGRIELSPGYIFDDDDDDDDNYNGGIDIYGGTT